MNKHSKMFVSYLYLISCFLLHRKFGNVLHDIVEHLRFSIKKNKEQYYCNLNMNVLKTSLKLYFMIISGRKTTLF